MHQNTARRGRHLRKDVLDFLWSFVGDNGYPPSYDEIRAAVGLSSRSHVGYYLDALEAEGLIDRIPGRPRGLRLHSRPPTRGQG